MGRFKCKFHILIFKQSHLKGNHTCKLYLNGKYFVIGSMFLSLSLSIYIYICILFKQKIFYVANGKKFPLNNFCNFFVIHETFLTLFHTVESLVQGKIINPFFISFSDEFLPKSEKKKKKFIILFRLNNNKLYNEKKL